MPFPHHISQFDYKKTKRALICNNNSGELKKIESIVAKRKALVLKIDMNTFERGVLGFGLPFFKCPF